ncbi:hypothetical protein CFP56_040713, partial [Quercus suber]
NLPQKDCCRVDHSIFVSVVVVDKQTDEEPCLILKKTRLKSEKDCCRVDLSISVSVVVVDDNQTDEEPCLSSNKTKPNPCVQNGTDYRLCSSSFNFVSVSAGKPSNITKSAALLVAFGAIKRGSLGPGSGRHDCEIILELYDKCMSRPHETASSCDGYLQQKEECRNFKREWEESEQMRATAAGFASMKEYHRHKHSKDPQMCRIAYENYKKISMLVFQLCMKLQAKFIL